MIILHYIRLGLARGLTLLSLPTVGFEENSVPSPKAARQWILPTTSLRSLEVDVSPGILDENRAGADILSTTL